MLLTICLASKYYLDCKLLSGYLDNVYIALVCMRVCACMCLCMYVHVYLCGMCIPYMDMWYIYEGFYNGINQFS